MLRSPALQIVSFIGFVLFSYAVSQAALTSPTPLLDQGPLGAQLRSAAPTRLAGIEAQLQRIITTGPQKIPANGNLTPLEAYSRGTLRQDTIKGGDVTPTPTEQGQLAANPAFRRAYANDPGATIRLLRQVDHILRDAQD
jgi:hypothetical protein